MKTHIVVFLLWLGCFGLCQCSSPSATIIDLSPLKLDRVELRLLAPVKPFSKQDIRTFLTEARKKVSAKSTAYFKDDSRFYMYIWTFSDEFKATKEVLRSIAKAPFEEWQITLQVHPTRLFDKHDFSKSLKKHAGIESIRQERLKFRLKWNDKATVGDALQTIADELMIAIVLEPKLLKMYSNDWQTLLSKILKLEKTESSNDITLESLIEILKRQLSATAELDDFLTFDVSEDTVELGANKTDAMNNSTEKE